MGKVTFTDWIQPVNVDVPSFDDEVTDEAYERMIRLEEAEEKKQQEKDAAADRHEFQREGDEEEWWTYSQFRVKMKTKQRIDRGANERGVGTERYMRYSMDDYHQIIDSRKPDEGDSVESRVRWRLARSEEIAEKYTNAFKIATNYADHPTDELFELLSDTCQEIGLDPDDLLQRIQREPIARAVASMRADSNTVVGRCAKWLARFFKDKDRMPSKEVNAIAREAGWAEQHVRRARNKLGMEIETIDGTNYIIVRKSARVLMGSEYDD